MKREDYTCRSGQPQAVDQTGVTGVAAREITRQMPVPRQSDPLPANVIDVLVLTNSINLFD